MVGELSLTPRRIAPANNRIPLRMVDDEPRDKCGIVGVALGSEERDARQALYYGLLKLQNRGQTSAGIAMYDSRSGNGINLRVLSGHVREFTRKLDVASGETKARFVTTIDDPQLTVATEIGIPSAPSVQGKRTILGDMPGNAGIGHVRYCTAGSAELVDGQPLGIWIGGTHMVFGFNGQVNNLPPLREGLKKELDGVYHFKREGDGEVLAALLAYELQQQGSFQKAIPEVEKRTKGSAYSFVALTNEGVIVVYRDRTGVRPLSMGFSDEELNDVMFASETIALDKTGFRYNKRDVKPGEMVLVENAGTEQQTVTNMQAVEPATPRSHCMFEWVYFANPPSVIQGRRVSTVRRRLGEELAREYGHWSTPNNPLPKPDAVVYVPDSAKYAADGLSAATGIPMTFGLVKDKHSPRTFTLEDKAEREEEVRLKFDVDPDAVSGLDLIVVDDSIVRGTTSRDLIQMLRDHGARNVEFWAACPAVISPCILGIDMATFRELIAMKDTAIKEVQSFIGADRLCYQTIDGLINAIGIGNNLCLGCVTGKQPTPDSQQIIDAMYKVEIARRATEVTRVPAVAVERHLRLPVYSTFHRTSAPIDDDGPAASDEEEAPEMSERV